MAERGQRVVPLGVGQHPPPGFSIEADSGKGLLDAAVIWAGVVGPHRLAMSQRARFTIRSDQPTQIHQNLGAAKAVVFLAAALPVDAGVATLSVVWGRDESLGTNQGAPYVLNGQLGGGGYGPTGFMQILLPGEDIYVQIVGVGSPPRAPITVAKVFF